MRTHSSPRWLALALLAALLAAGMRPAYAAPTRLQTFTISIVAYVDVFPVTDESCPGCNGVRDPEDTEYAQSNPLPEMEFVVLDSTGAEVGRQTTSALEVDIQNTVFTVDEGPEFTIEMSMPPSGWQLCPNESPTRTLTENDFDLGAAALEYHFTQGCNLEPTATPEAPTPEPGTPTDVPPGTPVPPKPTSKPSSSSASAGPALGYIKGFACIDMNGNGKVDPEDPGLNDVRVKVSGGSTTLYAVTPGTGAFSFDGLGAGTYEVSISVGPEWRVTTPTMYTVKLAPGQVAMGNDFCMVRAGGAVPAVVAPVNAGQGVRLPATGFANLPPAALMTGLTALLGALGALGLATERRRGRARDQ